MAYLKERMQEVEVDFSLESVWVAIPKVLAELGWEIKEKDETSNHLTVNAAGSLTSYGSMVKIDLTRLNEKTTRVTLVGDTPVTTITSTLDFTQTDDCIEYFIETFTRIMNS